MSTAMLLAATPRAVLLTHPPHRRSHEMDHSRERRRRPHRLPLADPAIRRSSGGIPVRSGRPSPGHRAGAERDAFRRRRRRAWARRRPLFVREHPAQVRPYPRSRAGGGRSGDSRRGHHRRCRRRAAGQRPQGDRVGVPPAARPRRPSQARAADSDVRRALRLGLRNARRACVILGGTVLVPSMASAELLARWRADTPGCLERNHLNNAGASLMPSVVLEAMLSHLRLESVRGGYEAEALAAAGVQDAYGAVAALLGCTSENIAIVENATVAIAQAMSAIELRPGDRVVTTNADYGSNQLMLLRLVQRFGIELRRASDLSEGGVDPEAVRELLKDGRCRLVVVTWVPTNSGLVQPVEEVARICAEA